MTARNRNSFVLGQAVRSAIKAIMLAHPPLAKPLTAKCINARLPPHLRRCERAIRYHALAIRREAAVPSQYVAAVVIPACETASHDAQLSAPQNRAQQE